MRHFRLKARPLVLAGLAALSIPHTSPAQTVLPNRTPQTVQERLGHPRGARLLVIHADDIGMAHSVNRASFAAFRNGWITSGSILVPCPWFPELPAFAKAQPEADLGIHLALNSEWTTFRWGPLLGSEAVPSLLDEQGYFPLVQAPIATRAKLDEVERELRAQIQRARNAGIRLTHLDTHMGTLGFSPGLFRVYQKLGREFGLPILQERRRTAETVKVEVPEDEALIDQVLAMENNVGRAEWRPTYEKMLAPLPAGVYELIVHLAHDDEEMQGATADHPDYGAGWRQNDFDLVSSEPFRRFLKDQGFVLVTWKDLARALPKDYPDRK
jgi:predicted glycoside hydrolase/deacetylase ChbG (UPF0249 family)